ncbi:MAG: aminopeptidase N [Pseudomonadales bacterium]|nr:aminopeptidase N [Pseudomonadales bacterium]
MAGAGFREIRLDDYRPPAFLVDDVALEFVLDPERTCVTSRLRVRRAAHTDPTAPLVLDGNTLELESIRVDGELLGNNQYTERPGKLEIVVPGAACEVEISTVIRPSANHSGEGMFVLNGQIATQCEAEGFRRLTYFPDRPDVLATYTVRLVADRARYPVLLSNGHLTASGSGEDGTHWAVWHDPHPKPSYIFAVMAGAWAKLEDTYVTGSGRRVALGIFADPPLIDQCQFAMGALKRALRWEEETFGLEYDLDCYHIVALSDYIGAMENKGLNLFDSQGIVADPQTTTDEDYLLIERILAHEVFHNWTGNRVTCRDWFQLSIKEGLTRFRDQLFAQDMGLPDYKRIDQVKALRRNQFPEDVGPAAHPVQPKAYLEIKNFYTATIYEKGAEVVRMLFHLLGRETFIRGVRHYLDTNDYQAVTKDAFLASMEATSGYDLGRFRTWYDQAGRPVVEASGRYDAAQSVYELTLTQRNGLADVQPSAGTVPYPIPVAFGLVGRSGRPVAAQLEGTQAHVLDFDGAQRVFRLENIDEPVVPSLFRGFSAPVTYQSGLAQADLAHLMVFDTDAFNRWDAAQQLGIAVIRALAADWRAGRPLELPEVYRRAYAAVLEDRNLDRAVLGEILRIPDEPALSDGLPQIDLDAHVAARRFVCQSLAAACRETLLAAYQNAVPQGPYVLDAHEIGRRRFRNSCLEMLVQLEQAEELELALRQVTSADNMTDCFEALAVLCQVACPQREAALRWFYERWRAYPRVIDKWFLVQALSRTADAVDRFEQLDAHPDMDPMNAPRAWAFYGSFFRQNRVAFHDPSGRGYDLLVKRLLFIDRYKPGASMRLMPQILQWRRYDPPRQALMKAALERVAAHEGISRGLYENVSRALGIATEVAPT